MKKFFKVLLLAAVALMPVMGMAQETPSQKDVEQKFEREMQLRQYQDSVAGARQAQLDRHTEKMAQLENETKMRMKAIWDEDVLIMVCSLGAGIIVLVLCLRHSRRKAEDHKELINKLIDNNLLNSTEPISKEAIEALMKPRKSDKERYIFDATLLGMGIAATILSVTEHLAEGVALVSYILIGIGLLRIVTRATFNYFENKNARKKATEAMREAKAKPIGEAEVIEEQ